VTTGAVWPDGGVAPVGNVVLLTAEDDLADTVRPRLDVMGADCQRVTALVAVETENGGTRAFDLRLSMPALVEAVAKTQASLVIIDPVTAFLGGTDSFKDSEVRGVLAPLTTLAQDTDAAILCIMHLNKNTQARALYRGQGSIAFQGIARAAHIVAADKVDPDRRLLLPLKMNLGPRRRGLAYRVESIRHPDGFDVARIVWETDPVEVDVEDILTGPGTDEERSAREEAEEFLQNLLKDGPLAQQVVKEEARKAGIARRTLDRVKKSLGVRSVKRRYWWDWMLDSKDAKDANSAKEGAVGTLEAQEGGAGP
jgi:hypothetical protein